MGLFIGASILTILELFDYLYEVRDFLFFLFKMLFTVNANLFYSMELVEK